MAFNKIDFRRALRKVRTKLLNGTITKEQFDMSIPLCGTSGCIGGHMAIELDPRVLNGGIGAMGLMSDAIHAMNNLHVLFYEYPIIGVITRRQAANAITKALDGSYNPWERSLIYHGARQ